MRYLLLIYGEAAAGETPTRTPPERAVGWQAFWRGAGRDKILECDDLEQALDFAKRVPCGPHGSIEVRAVAGSG